MKFTGLFVAGAIVFSINAGSAVPATAATSSQLPIVGTWELIQADTIRPNGERIPLNVQHWGLKPTGMVSYGADGWMSVQIAGTDRPTVAKDDANRRNHPPERGALIANSYYAYYGRYELDMTANKVRHSIVQSLHPDETGQVYERRFQIDGDILTLTTTFFQEDGEERFNQIRWKRVTPPASIIVQTNTGK